MLNRTNLPTLVVLAIYLLLAAVSVRGVGVVGEVAIGWALPSTPDVVVDYDENLEPIGPLLHDLGPLRASQVRPVEELTLGPLNLPFAINQYTGGPPDWPSRIVYWITGSLGVVTAFHVLLGGVLIALVCRFLQFHATALAAAIAGLALATDWSFLFYKKVLGGTELLLQAAGLLFIWALWSRRHRGGRHGAEAIAVATGLGLLAKITFAPVVAALSLAALLTRWDRTTPKPPPKPPILKLAAIVLLLSAPLTISWLHHTLLAPPHIVRSHDFLDLQFDRLFASTTQDRETLVNLIFFALDPLPWFELSYKVDAVTPRYLGRAIGWGLMLFGSVLAWRTPHKSPAAALTRFLSIALPLEIAALTLSNRDLHHLAQLTPQVAILFGLSLERVAGHFSPPRSPKRWMLALALAIPFTSAGVSKILRSDEVLSSTPTHPFTERGQVAMLELLNENGVERLFVSDYDLYGTLEIRAPEIETRNVWPDISHRRERHGSRRPGVGACEIPNHPCGRAALQDLLRSASGGHYLAVRPSAPMIYNRNPDLDDLEEAAAFLGLEVTLVDQLEDERGAWARLFAVRAP